MPAVISDGVLHPVVSALRGPHYRGATRATTVGSGVAHPRCQKQHLKGGGDAALLPLWQTAGDSVESAVV